MADETTPKRRPLNAKQRIFVEQYLTNGFNATKAAISAGYSEKTARVIGYENLTKPYIRAEIEIYLAEMTLSREEILVRVADLARADFADYLTIKDVPDLAKLLSRPEPKEGEERPPMPMETVAELDLLKAVQNGKTYAIEAVEHGKYGLRVKVHDKLKALELAGRAKGMFKDKVEVTGKDGGDLIALDDLVKALQEADKAQGESQ
jgi:phage terminase small subunit